jgi:hypothetical protein
MLVWINGAFGVGKTTTALRVRELEPRWRHFDPEYVGFMLRAQLDGVAISDFQDLPAWRTLVPAVANEVLQHTGDDLIAVQTVLRQDYWRELRAGLAERDIALVHIVLDADAETLRARIEADQHDPAARQWRLDHVVDYTGARAWLLVDADVVIDASNTSPDACAAAVLAAAHA